jgi:NAD(P)H-flavin reductase/ferredoxin
MPEHQITIQFPDGERSILAREDETILTAARRQGLPLIAECELALCGTCKAVKESGAVAVDEEEPQGLTLMDIRNNAILACQSYARSDVRLRLPYRLTTISEAKQFAFDAPIVALARLADAVVKVTVDGRAAAGLTFLPGQYVNMAIPGSDKERSYSFSSGPERTDNLEFLIRILPDGLMSNYLRNTAAIGQKLRIRGPYGAFFLREGVAPLLFIAGGTGLGPFLSMLDHLVATGQTARPVRLLYGVNDRAAELSSIDRLDAFKARLHAFDYAVAVAKPDPEWTGTVGFVTTLLNEDCLFDGRADAYLCGPPAMVEAGETWLRANGLPSERIYFERFVPS